MRIVVVEDEAPIREGLAKILSRWIQNMSW